MLEAMVRPRCQDWFFEPLARSLKDRVSANSVTAVAGVLGVFVPIALILGHPYLAVLALLLSGYCDCLDGTLARLQQNSSPFGTALDICTDRFVEFLVVYALYLYAPAERASYCFWMLGSILLCVTSFLVVGIFQENASTKGFYYSPGIMERAEAFVFFGLMLLLPGWFVPLSITFSVLVFVTSAVRLYEFYRQL